MLAIGAAGIWRSASVDRETLVRSGRDLAEMLAYKSQAAIYQRDLPDLERSIERLEPHPDVLYVRILDASGAPMVGRMRSDAPDPLVVPHNDAVRVGAVEAIELDREGSDPRMLEIQLPVQSLPDRGGNLFEVLAWGIHVPRIIGYVQLGMVDARLTSALTTQVLTTTAITLSIALLGGALAFFWSRRITGPIARLADVTRGMSEGNFDLNVRDALESTDEVGQLARALDATLERLRAYQGQVEKYQHDLEDQGEEYQHNLEDQVDERTRDLHTRTEEAVELAREAQEANRAKSQFLANMSHEIRTPMNDVLGMTELLLASELSPRQEKFAKTVHQSARNLLDLINDSLDFSRAEAGKLQLEPETFELREAIGNVADLLAEQAQTKGLVLTCCVADDVPQTVSADPVHLRQILTHLVGNAVKFTEEGEVVIGVVQVARADEAAADASRCLLEFSVTDTGIGVPEEARKRLFQSFTQADGSMARRFVGTGLGLAISKDLVERMGGEIDFETEENRGSRFWFRVPVELSGAGASRGEPDDLSEHRTLVVEENPKQPNILVHQLGLRGAEVVEAENPAASPPREATQEKLLSVDVLLVEDNEVNREVAVAVLTSLGCRVRVAPDGRQGVEILERESFDLVFMDCQMPVMDGFAATRAIRERERQQDENAPLPIIALTAHAMAQDREDCLAAGMDDHLSKPFARDEIREVIERWTGTRRQRSAAARHATHTPEPASATVPESVDTSVHSRLRSLEADAGSAVLQRVIEAYLRSSTELERAIRDGLAAEDPLAAARAAHTLKSSSAQVGADHLAILCKELESLGRGGSLEGAPALADQISAQLENVREALVVADFGVRDA